MQTACAAIVLGALVSLTVGQASAEELTRVTNPGFEEVGADGSPAGWAGVGGLGRGTVTQDSPHAGTYAGRIDGDGHPHAWRQELLAPPTRLYTASGWFRAQGAKLNAKADPEEYARFYFHILYKNRPYSDASQIYRDLPAGTYGWTRVSVLLVPQAQWPIDRIWVTVAGLLPAGTLDFDDIEVKPAEARGGASVLEWANGLKPAMLTDMSRATPTRVLSPRAGRGRWKVIPYQIASYQGKMVWASDETDAPSLTLPLGAKGWHAVYLGLADPGWLGSKVLAKLTGDPAYVPRGRTQGQVEEAFLKVADVTGKSLHFAQQAQGYRSGAGLAYVKLVPLTPEEVARAKADRADPAHRRLVATIDGFSYIYERRPTTAAALLQEVETFRGSDFGTLILQMGGADMVNYPSRFGEMRGLEMTDFARAGDRYYAEAIRELARKRINPTKVLIDGAHKVGMRVHVSIRPAAWVCSEPLSEFFNSRFYQAHPEWRCVDRDGSVVPRMSFAVPQVRAHLLDVLREAVAFGADGANLLFARGMPLILYEKPFLALFRQRYGADALKVEESAPRLRKLRGEIMTGFVRQARRMLDEEARRRANGKRLALSVFALANEEDNLRFGLDVRRWVKEGLVGLVLPYLGAGGGTAPAYDLAFYREVCAPAGVPVKPTFIGWSTPDLAGLMRKAVDYYDQGADGLTIWDANSGAEQTDRWSVVSRLGHVEELRERAQEGPPQPATLRFHRLGGTVMDGRYHPDWGF